MDSIESELANLEEEFHQENRTSTEHKEEFVTKSVGKLAEQLKEQGDHMISQLSNPMKMGWMRSEGGDGFIVRYLPKNWRKIPSRYTYDTSIEDLQDRIFRPVYRHLQQTKGILQQKLTLCRVTYQR